MDGPGSQQRMIVALLIISGAALGVALTIEPGRYRSLAWALLGFFAFRVLLGFFRQRHTDRSKG